MKREAGKSETGGSSSQTEVCCGRYCWVGCGGKEGRIYVCGKFGGMRNKYIRWKIDCLST